MDRRNLRIERRSSLRRTWCLLILGTFGVAVSDQITSADLLHYEAFLLPDSDGDPISDPAESALGEYNLGVLDPSDASDDGQNPVVGPTPFLSGSWERLTDAPNGAVQATSLSYRGSPSLGGSQSTIPNTRQSRFLSDPWTASATGTFYLGYQVNFGQGNYADANGISNGDLGYRATEFWRDDGSFAMGITYNSFSSTIGPSQQHPSTARMYADFTGTGGVHQIISNSPQSFVEDGATHLVVLRFDLSADPASDSISVYLDPKSPIEPSFAGAALTNIDFTLGAIGGATIFGGTGTFPVYDELRLATTFAEAVPDLPIPGDTNGDDQVDITDYLVILANMNMPGFQTTATGDVTGDGRVTIADFRLWKERRTDVAMGSGGIAPLSGTVPEPTTVVSLTIALAFLTVGRNAIRRT